MTRESSVEQPLLGTRILLTAHRRASELGAALGRRGAELQYAPVLSIVPHVDDDDLVARTLALIDDPPDVVVVTTGVGFRGWLESADAAGVAMALHEVLEQARLVARGPKAQGAIHGAGLSADWVAVSETAAEIKELFELEGVRGLHVAVQHHGAGSDGIDELLVELGARVTSLVVYRWGPPPDEAVVREAVWDVARAQVDAVVFTSAPGATEFLRASERAGCHAQVVESMRGPVLAAVVGPVTAVPLREVGVEPLVPDRYRMGALVRAVTVELVGRQVSDVATCAGPLRVTRDRAVLDGQVLAVSPGSLEVMRVLARARGAVVSREALLEALPGGSRDPHRVEVAVARLRESLGASDIVRTVVRRGYRLAVDATEDVTA